MPFCPNCRDEFQEWVKVCPDCGVALVDELPKPPKKEKFDDRIMLVAAAPNEAVANIWAEILEEEGIPCLLQSPDLKACMYSIFSNQPYLIYVLKTNALRAKRILSSFEKGRR